MVERSRKEADAQPRDTDGARTLSNFYYDRGLAASRIGRSGQEIADYRKAMKYAREAGNWEVQDMGGWLLGLADMFAGSFSDAVADWERAIEISKSIGLIEDAVISYAVLADLYAKAGDPEGVKIAAERSKKSERTGGGWEPEQETIYEWRAAKGLREASLMEVAGRYKEAEPHYRDGIRSYDLFLGTYVPTKGDAEFDAAMYNLFVAGLADNLRKQGRLVEAEVWARRTLTTALKTNGRYSAHTAYMLGLLTRVVYEQGRFADAEKLGRANIDAYEKSGASTQSLQYALTRMRLADILGAQGRWKEALAEYEKARGTLAQDAYATRKFVAGNVNWGIALLESGEAAESISVFDAATARLTPIYGAEHYVLAEVAGFKAKALAKMGKREEALKTFFAAIPVLLEGARRDAGQEGVAFTRGRRMRGILGAYIELLSEIGGTRLEARAGFDTAAEAFRVADAARMQSVQQALSASAARAAVRDPGLADLVRREQDTRQQADALLVRLADMLSRPTSEQSADAVSSLRGEISLLLGARDSILKEIESRFPEYADLMNPKPITVDQVQAVLGSDESLITTYVADHRTYVWAVPKTGRVAFASAKLGRDDLAETVALLRAALEPRASVLGDIPDFDVAAAHGLYTALLEPVKAGWQGSKSLLAVSDGPLGYLPLGVLPTADTALPGSAGALFSNYQAIPWLVRSHAVTVLPSVASLKTLRGVPAGDAARKAFIGFGDPYFNQAQATEGAAEVASAVAATRGLQTRALPVKLRATPETQGAASADISSLPRLPDTAEEIRSIALALKADPSRDLFLGERASEGAVKTADLAGYKVMAFATHGLVPGDLDGLTQPALALSSPQVVGGNEDGLLTMGEILGLKLNADWVVLSACNTGSGQGAGAEAVSGLGRAFFYAGTRALLVSNWPVETTSAKALTTDLFRRQAADPDLTRAEALRRATVALMDGPGLVEKGSGPTIFSYAHPIFWAPFSLIGDGGGGAPAS